MFITKKHISRRALLRGAMGATVALPFLDSMVPALSAAPASPFRFGAVYFPCGVWPDTWRGRHLPPGGERVVPDALGDLDRGRTR